MKIDKEEIFGKVKCVIKLKKMNEEIERENKKRYGIEDGIVKKEINKEIIFEKCVEDGNVWVKW